MTQEILSSPLWFNGKLFAIWLQFRLKLTGQGVEVTSDLFRETFVLLDLDIDLFPTTDTTMLADRSHPPPASLIPASQQFFVYRFSYQLLSIFPLATSRLCCAETIAGLLDKTNN